jgi:hypothetical protein
MDTERSQPTEEQKKIASLLNIDVSTDSQEVAAARIREVVEPAINPDGGYRSPTQSQIELAQKLGLDVSSDSFWVCFAKISEKLDELNQEALERLQLMTGDWVKRIQFVEFKGKRHRIEKKYQVSSVGRDGKVYFKGGNGYCAWPTQLEKIENEL